MREIELGLTGVRITEFIVGAGNIGGIGSSVATRGRGLSPVEGMAMLDAAFDRGIRVVDTANSYAGGESERVVGRWVADHDDVLIETKVGGLADAGQTEPDLSPESIARHASASAERLGRFELYLTHAPDSRTPIERTIEAMTSIVDGGAAHAWGVSNVDVRWLDALGTAAARLGVRGPGWVQNGFSLLAPDDEVQRWCADARLGYTGYSPLAGGLLSDRYLDAPPEPGSRLDVAGAMYPTLDAELRDRLQKLHALGVELGSSSAGLALWWLRWHPFVTATIVSPRRTAQWTAVDEALAHGDDPQLHARVGALFT